MKEKNINVNSENLSYFDSEKGNITLFFIHGAFISKEYWNNQLSYFATKYRVIAIDLAGHGNSTHNRTEWTVQNYGKEIREFINKLSLKNVILIGHSFGSDIMLETIIDNSTQINGLIEIDHLKNVGAEMPKENINQLVKSLKSDFKNTCEQYAKQALITDETNSKIVNKLLKDYRQMNPDVGIPLLQNNFKYPSRETELLKALKSKLYLIHVNYMATNEESLKKYLGNKYELHTLNGSCHYPMLEKPNKFNELLEKIILKIKKIKINTKNNRKKPVANTVYSK